MNKHEKIADLRHFLARYGLPPDRPALPLGVADADAALGGGLMPGALHEVYAEDWAAGGFAACLAIRAAGKKPLFWVRPDYEALEYGALYAPRAGWNWAAIPKISFWCATANAAEALAAASRHSGLPACGRGAAGIVRPCPKRWIWWPAAGWISSPAKPASPLFLLREGADAMPSAAQTRWQVSTPARLPAMRIGALPSFTRRHSSATVWAPPGAGP